MWEINYATVVAAIGSALATLVLTKLWDDLIPKQRIATWPRVIGAVLAVMTALSLYKFVKVINDGNPIIAAMSALFLTNVGITAWTALAGGIYLWRQHKRVEAIEKHVGLATHR